MPPLPLQWQTKYCSLHVYRISVFYIILFLISSIIKYILKFLVSWNDELKELHTVSCANLIFQITVVHFNQFLITKNNYCYAPPTVVEGYYVFWSVHPFVRLSVCSFVCLSRFRLECLIKVVFDEVEVQSTSNLVHMFPMIWSF